MRKGRALDQCTGDGRTKASRQMESRGKSRSCSDKSGVACAGNQGAHTLATGEGSHTIQAQRLGYWTLGKLASSCEQVNPGSKKSLAKVNFL